jgi:hypothetical protein
VSILTTTEDCSLAAGPPVEDLSPSKVEEIPWVQTGGDCRFNFEDVNKFGSADLVERQKS